MTADDEPVFRPEAIEARRHPDTTGVPVNAPVTRRASAMARAVGGALAKTASSARRRLGRRKDPALRYVAQVEASDCGAACLVTVLDHFGIDVPLPEMRQRVDPGPGGTSALTLLRVARSYGLNARGVKAGADQVSLLPRGTILHWKLDHFVVLDEATKDGVYVVDPAFGHRHVPLHVFDRSFTGIALLFDGPRVRHAALPADPRRRAWAHVLPLLRDAGLLRSVALTALVSQTLVLSFPFVLRYALDVVIPSEATGSLRRLSLLVIPLLLTQVFVLGMRAVTLSWLRARIDYRLSLAILGKMLSLPYSFLIRRTTGDLLLRVRSTSALRQTFTTAVLSGIVDGLTAFSLLAVVLVLDPRLAAVTFVLVGAQAVVLAAAWHHQWQLTVGGLEAQAASQARLVELLSGVQSVKIAGAENDTADAWAQMLAEETNWEISRSISSGVTDALLQALRVVAPVVLVFVGTSDVLAGRVATGTMVAATSLAVAAVGPVTVMLGSAFQLASVRAHLDRINDVFDEDSETGGGHAPAETEGRLGLDSVTFTYPGTREPVLRDVSLTVRPGECVVVTGRSGTGKSTLAMLLAGLYRPDGGRVLLDGEPLESYDLATLRARLGYVPQDPQFFGGTIRDNITLFRDVPDDVVRRAVDLACIGEDLARLPVGLDTILVERGKSMSGGQLQRLGLARALVASPRVLVLDEATSALDPVVEEEVLDRVLGIGITTVMITHRESVAARADRVLHLDSGRLSEVAPR
ncbi:MAG TPA: peptidase domain-containing ABC transporter [Frankiaceae bacterium]|nr:peptidase domain-containing ABC transporter [Frankiaceae bacterium]